MDKVRLICNKCTHEWTPKKPEIKPRICPKCKTEKWDIINNINIKNNNQPHNEHDVELKDESLKEQKYIEAKKIVDMWEATHGGPGSLKRCIDAIRKMFGITYQELWNYTDDQLETMMTKALAEEAQK